MHIFRNLVIIAIAIMVAIIATISSIAVLFILAIAIPLLALLSKANRIWINKKAAHWMKRRGNANKNKQQDEKVIDVEYEIIETKKSKTAKEAPDQEHKK